MFSIVFIAANPAEAGQAGDTFFNVDQCLDHAEVATLQCKADRCV